MHLYRIGPARGAQRIGLTRDPDTTLARMRESSGQEYAIRTWDLPTGQAQLVERVIHVRLKGQAQGDGWFKVFDAKAMDACVDDVIQWTNPAGIAERAVCDLAGHARAMKHLRVMVFGTTQDQIGAIVGRSAGIICRWEAGTSTPGLEELLKLRAYARALGLPWEDSLLLDPPAA
jgi:hypothetical protein